ncbi:polynucleotide adenylyltransferase PcnB [Luteimonas sp. FXH3W]|uniref:Poly(A) polymerase I n=1 Tax=Aquilutibacter rugosus TaxID=3115820 RepID=A0ABU7V290_9GAMM
MPTHRHDAEPLIIPRDAHNVSRREISANALKVLYKLHNAGYEAYLVGGAVRDLLVDGHPKDFDIACNATPEQVKHLFRNCRLIGRRFRLAHVVFGRDIIEVATFRGNEDDGSGDRHVGQDGRVVRDNIYGTVDDDAWRRDFTANALYYSIADFSIRDDVNGFEDIRNRVLRLIGDPVTRYREDPVRMLRAVRLAAKLGFTIEPDTAAPIPELAPLLADVSPARLYEETKKMFLAGHAVASFEGLERYDLLRWLFPGTAKALARNANGSLRRMLMQGLANTDVRVRNGDSVAPYFLFAVLMWPEFCLEFGRLAHGGMGVPDAQRRAADRVVVQQLSRVAIPRRDTLPMQEVWLMQERLRTRQRRRVSRLLTHPRFRAAYDFLQLRLSASEEHRADVDFWTQAQQLPADALDAMLANGNERAKRKDR